MLYETNPSKTIYKKHFEVPGESLVETLTAEDFRGKRQRCADGLNKWNSGITTKGVSGMQVPSLRNGKMRFHGHG